MKFGLIAGLRRNARERINAIFLLPVLLISLGSKSGASFLAERAETCQYYFWLYLQKRFGRRRHRLLKSTVSVGQIVPLQSKSSQAARLPLQRHSHAAARECGCSPGSPISGCY